jgi:hypothetical protein
VPQIEGLAEKQVMRNGQNNNNKRMRGRNRKGGGHHQNPLSRVYESNGQDVKIRGTASHIAEKYLQLARDAQSSGDTIATENYYQHAEHYFRLIAAAQEQLRQSQPYFQPQPGDPRGNQAADDGYDDGDGDGDGDQPPMAGEPFAPREPQQFYPREQQHHQPQQYQPQHRHPQHQPQHQQPQPYQPRQQHVQPPQDGDVERLPSFITGGGQPQNQPQQTGQGQNGALNGGNGQSGGQNSGNGQNGFDGSPDRFPLHRRRRRHRGPGPREHSADQSGSEGGGLPPGLPSSDE